MKRWQTMVGALALAVGLSLSGCGAENGETVAVQSVAMLTGMGTVGLQNKYAGEIVPQATHEIKKEADRTVDEVMVEVGDYVTAGQILFTYDVEEIRFSVEAAELELEKIQNEIASSRKQITQLEKEKKKASKNAQLSYSIEIQSLEADIKESEYTYKTKQKELERLRNTMDNTVVYAEVDGTIQSIKSEDDSQNNAYDDYGDGSADTFITIVETGAFRVKGKVNEMNIQDIGMMEGSPVIVRSRVDAEQTWAGTLGSVDTEKALQSNNNYFDYGNSDDSTTSSKYAFYVDLEESEGLLMGQHVYIELNQGQDDEQGGIHLAAYFICREESGDYVWAATPKDKLEKRQVELGEYNEELDTWEVVNGLTLEDYIAIPSEDLREGMPVTRYDEAYFEPGGTEGNSEEGMEEDFGEDEMMEENGTFEDFEDDEAEEVFVDDEEFEEDEDMEEDEEIEEEDGFDEEEDIEFEDNEEEEE